MLTVRPVILADAELSRKAEPPAAATPQWEDEEEQLYLIELRYQECMARRALLELFEEPMN